MNRKEFSRIRQHLGKTQKEMAQLLGTSVKAIQSFEQGWRSVPGHIERQALDAQRPAVTDHDVRVDGIPGIAEVTVARMAEPFDGLSRAELELVDVKPVIRTGVPSGRTVDVALVDQDRGSRRIVCRSLRRTQPGFERCCRRGRIALQARQMADAGVETSRPGTTHRIDRG